MPEKINSKKSPQPSSQNTEQKKGFFTNSWLTLSCFLFIKPPNQKGKNIDYQTPKENSQHKKRKNKTTPRYDFSFQSQKINSFLIKEKTDLNQRSAFLFYHSFQEY